MGTFMRAADCILGKAGGLTVSEALACGLPMILVDVIPGQETGNAEYVVSGNAGVLARDPVEVLETVYHWLEKDRRLYCQQAENARRLGHPRAAYDIADLAWVAASA
jgi:UDP-N-acetylglucosamine:LPS N-acetylglucosamine transferase